MTCRYREIRPYPPMKYREIDPVRFAHAPEDLKVGQNGENEHYLETLIEREDEMYDVLVTDRILDFIDRQTRSGTPFFIHIGLEKPHRPWTVPRPYLNRFKPEDMPLPDTIADWQEKGHLPFAQTWCHTATRDDDARRAIAAYYTCVAEIDDCVARILETCRKLDILGNTIILYTSDHGESLYDHGLIEKHNMYEPSVRVPFILYAPGFLPGGTVTQAPSSLLDILPTLCEMTGVPGAEALEGVSLCPTFTGKADPDRLVFSEFYEAGSGTRPEEFLPIRMGLNAGFKYVYTHAAADQLYARDTDGEAAENNLAFNDAMEESVSRMRLCTLNGWELDEYPALSAEARCEKGRVHLSWEAAAANARYDIYCGRSPDPRQARRIAAGIRKLTYTDASPAAPELYYWVLGHYALTRPFTDPHGKRRYGGIPITQEAYPRSLPLTPCMRVSVRDESHQTFAYKPRLGCTLFGQPWIHVGMAPREEEGQVEISGPLTLLTPRTLGAAYRLTAKLCTPIPGKSSGDTLKIVANYQNMHRFDLIGLDTDGTLGIWRQRVENDRDELAAIHLDTADASALHTLSVQVDGTRLRVDFNGKTAIDITPPAPLPPGRAGFEAPPPPRFSPYHRPATHPTHFLTSVKAPRYGPESPNRHGPYPFLF